MMSLPVWLPGPMFLPGVSVTGPIFLPGGLCLGEGISVQGVSVQGGLCPGGSYVWGFLPEVSAWRESLFWGSLS